MNRLIVENRIVGKWSITEIHHPQHSPETVGCDRYALESKKAGIMFKSDDPGNQEQDREQGKRPPVYEIKRIVEIREARVLRYDKNENGI